MLGVTLVAQFQSQPQGLWHGALSSMFQSPGTPSMMRVMPAEQAAGHHTMDDSWPQKASSDMLRGETGGWPLLGRGLGRSFGLVSKLAEAASTTVQALLTACWAWHIIHKQLEV